MMKTLFLLTWLLFDSLGFAQEPSRTITVLPENHLATIYDKIQEAVNIWNTNMPQTLENVPIRLELAEAVAPNIFRYVYTNLSATKDTPRPGDDEIQACKEELTRAISNYNQPPLLILKHLDVIFECVFKNSEGGVVFTLQILPSEYNSSTASERESSRES
jgi:hypothetical protein